MTIERHTCHKWVNDLFQFFIADEANSGQKRDAFETLADSAKYKYIKRAVKHHITHWVCIAIFYPRFRVILYIILICYLKQCIMLRTGYV